MNWVAVVVGEKNQVAEKEVVVEVVAAAMTASVGYYNVMDTVKMDSKPEPARSLKEVAAADKKNLVVEVEDKNTVAVVVAADVEVLKKGTAVGNSIG